jgi:hypothetical protein
MLSVGVKRDPAEFVAAVAESFRAAEAISDSDRQERFRRSHSYRDFRGMLRKTDLPPDARLLAVGCGYGLAGRGAEYPAAVIREIYPLAEVDQANYTIRSEGPIAGRYDLVVTHSMLHFALDFAPLCDYVLRRLAPGGVWVMANEPNARFWRNAQCVAELERVNAAEGRRRNLLKYADPSRYLVWLLRAMRPDSAGDITAEVNRQVRERLGIQSDLSAREILRIVDPHVRDPFPGTSPLGSDGLDWDDLAGGPLLRMKLDSVRTSGYVMRDNPARLPERWRELNREMARRFPMDGCSFTALWRSRS